MIIAVIGGSSCNQEEADLAYNLGQAIAREGYILVCGGMGGIMESACRGAWELGGLTVGILPGKEKIAANPYVLIPVVTELSHARNAIIVRTADAVVAVAGSYGTLSEIALALVMNKPVWGIKTWDIPGLRKGETVEQVMGEIKKFFQAELK